MLTIAGHLCAQDLPRGGWFVYAPYGRSLYADVHPFMPRLDIGMNTNHLSYDYSANLDKKYRFTTHGLFGFNLDIWRGEWSDGQFGLLFSFAMSADLWLDVAEPVTAPVVNTDYRISAPTTTFIQRFDNKYARNYSISWTPFRHESTHIGDEMQIQRIDNGYALKRVNVSYNYTELAVTLNEPEDKMRQTHTVRLGVMLLYNWAKGWYFIDQADGDSKCASPRRSPWEAYLQYQYQSPTSRHGFQGIGSAELRNRALYGYDLLAKDNTTCPIEKRIFTVNLFAGVRYNMPHYDGYFSGISIGWRFYYGNCPYGQFRSIPNYLQTGLCLIFD